MDWIKGATYIFQDKSWHKKMLIGSLVTSVPLVEAITNSYQIKVIENIKAGNPQPLPEWENMGEMFGKGLKLWLAVSLFYIPSIIISVISWFLGIPLLFALIASFLASMASDDYLQARGIAFVLSYVLFPLISIIVTGIGVFIGSVLLPAVFFLVPAMALRMQETDSLISTMNIFANIKFVLKHLGDYILARLCVFGMIIGMELIATFIGGATVWVVGLGFLLSWLITSAARFWSRTMWAFYLANMRLKEQTPNGNPQFNQIQQNPQIERQYTNNIPLTQTPKRQHYVKNDNF